MSLKPVETTQAIRKQYLSYLKSKFISKDQSIGKQAAALLEIDNKFVKGPYVEVTPPFMAGKTLNELINEGVLAKDISLVNQQELPVNRPLYSHQEEAIINIVSKNRNAVIATGTGSGKTECFLIPIINSLMREKEEKGTIDPGVRTLLLYPMNALANDQVDRLRLLLQNYPDITFGRYTGETLKDKDAAEQKFRNTRPDLPLLPNELLSREQMQKSPPHILLTNYAMLEYLLLRPADNVFFDGEYSGNWRFIVLDEAHTYNGAKGTEISLLLARLKERVTKSTNQKMQFIATSATLGSGDNRRQEIAQFANDIFDVRNEIDTPFKEGDLIEAKRIPYYSQEGMQALTLADYRKLDDLSADGNEEQVYEALKNDANVYKLREYLVKDAKLVKDAAEHLFGKSDLTASDRTEALVTLIKLASGTKVQKGDHPLLPARYHVFVRALEGAYIAFYPEKKVFLDRHKYTSTPEIQEIPVFELANCERCGQEYLYGHINDSHESRFKYLEQGDSVIDELGNYKPSKCDFYLVGKPPIEVIADEDAHVMDNLKDKVEELNNMQEYILCTACGSIVESERAGHGQCCDAQHKKLIRIYGRKGAKRSSFNNCYACGANRSNVVKRFFSSDDAATQVIGETLYENIPAHTEKIEPEFEANSSQSIFSTLISEKHETTNESVDESKRKLLVFSDSRQDAAFYASFMDRKYQQNLWRHTILDVLSQATKEYDFYNLNDLLSDLIRVGNGKQLFSQYETDKKQRSLKDKKSIVSKHLMYEFHRHEKRMGLEGLGLIAFDLAKLKGWPSIPIPDTNIILTDDEAWTLTKVLFDSFREGRCTTYLKDVHAEDDFFEPRNRQGYISLSEGSTKMGATVLNFLPAPGYSNKRVDYVQKILERKGVDKASAKKSARDFLTFLISNNMFESLSQQGYLTKDTSDQKSIIYQLNHERYNILYKPEMAYRCDTCGSFTLHNLFDICSEYRCTGTLRAYTGVPFERLKYFVDLYENKKPIPMTAKEHTAQLTSQHATNLQNDFEEGKVNILSCSTTFELGVDVGQLEAVFLRNVPPETSNYIQRAGRAGRRTDSTAFSLTYAKKRSHDLTYFQNPARLISGQIKTPYIVKDNEKIILRHVYAVALAWFFRKYPGTIENVSTFFGFDSSDDATKDSTLELHKLLKAKPDDLLESLKQIIPEGERDFEYFNHNDYWGWVDLLLNENTGTLTLAGDDLRSTIKSLIELKNSKFRQGDNVDSLSRNINTYQKKNLISFLASKNILPRYGFPVDVVPLRLLNSSPEAQHVELDRDLRIAISEYAPGGSVIANGKVWKPYALIKVPQKDWPTFYYAICESCKHVYRYSTALGTIPDTRQLFCSCGGNLTYSYYVEPSFGFSTDVSSSSNPGERRDPRTYSTRVLFERYKETVGDEKGDPPFQTKLIQGKNISYRYSARGQLLLFNQGYNKSGFMVCRSCGFMAPGTEKIKETHENCWKNECRGKLTHTHFGHEFMTDVLEIRLPELFNMNASKFSWQSLLFAILEGASLSLGINRNEISGTLYHNNVDKANNIPSIMIYDDVPGGAGHVKRIAERLNDVLFQAKQKVSGYCGCGEETSCYGCLRNYSNQYMHEALVRGDAFYYLDSLLTKDSVESIKEDVGTTKSEDLHELPSDEAWAEAVTYASSDEARIFAIDAAQFGCEAPSQFGYEVQLKSGKVIGEAEFVWENRKIAVFTVQHRDTAEKMSQQGYKTFMIGEDNEKAFSLTK